MKDDQLNDNTSKTVLVVEDSPVQAYAIIQLLEQRGITVLCAPDGATGLALAKTCLPDLIIMDVQMPGIDGLETCHLIKEDPAIRDVPVIFLTALSDPDTLRRGFGEGAVDFIPKDVFSDVVLLKTLVELDFMNGSEVEDVR
jgi:CheY-like chemotaxis protein